MFSSRRLGAGTHTGWMLCKTDKNPEWDIVKKIAYGWIRPTDSEGIDKKQKYREIEELHRYEMLIRQITLCPRRVG